jgi:hypothetical protein
MEKATVIPTRKRLVLLHLNGKVIRTRPDHPFSIHRRGWTNAAELRCGDLLRTTDGQDVPLAAITATGEEIAVYRMDAALPLFLCAGLWPAGTLVETADGPKPVDDIGPGDRIVVPDPCAPERN